MAKKLRQQQDVEDKRKRKTILGTNLFFFIGNMFLFAGCIQCYSFTPVWLIICSIVAAVGGCLLFVYGFWYRSHYKSISILTPGYFLVAGLFLISIQSFVSSSMSYLGVLHAGQLSMPLPYIEFTAKIYVYVNGTIFLLLYIFLTRKIILIEAKKVSTIIISTFCGAFFVSGSIYFLKIAGKMQWRDDYMTLEDAYSIFPISVVFGYLSIGLFLICRRLQS